MHVLQFSFALEMTTKILAFVLVSTEVGQEQDVAAEVKRIPGVREAHVVYGLYDVIVELEGDDQEAIRSVVFSKIRALSHVKSSLTLVVSEG